MNGSNSLAESDRHPVHFCAEDEMKVFWAQSAENLAHRRGNASRAACIGPWDLLQMLKVSLSAFTT